MPGTKIAMTTNTKAIELSEEWAPLPVFFEPTFQPMIRMSLTSS